MILARSQKLHVQSCRSQTFLVIWLIRKGLISLVKVFMVNTISLCVLSDIAALIRELNNLSNGLSQLSEENEALREQLGLDPRQQVDLSPLRFRKKNEFEKLNQEYKLLSNEVSY